MTLDTGAPPKKDASGVEDAVELMIGRRVVALTGAGISTDSGIPDYRGPGSAPRRPMTYQEFVSGRVAQQRYWARAHLGWTHLETAEPNPGHRALARMQRAGVVVGLITQNVDGLHVRAGSPSVIELHGRIADVICLRCRRISARAELHHRLAALNPGYANRAAQIAPDGDAVFSATSDFRLASCTACDGPLKPDVVFFGECVPRHRVTLCTSLVSSAEVMLVVGSSLQVWSGLRFVRQAARERIPVVVVNRGRTRGDELTTVKIDAGCSPTLEAILAASTGGTRCATTAGVGRSR
jgi:NAD-dependent SIR2 family protein deacetylase